jgi:hypothetical protein
MSTSSQQTDLHRPATEQRWHPGAWIALLLATGVVAAISLVATWFVVAFGGSTCNEAPTPSEVWEGQSALLVIIGLTALPWGLLAFFVRPRGRVVAAGLVCVAAPVLCLVLGLNPDFWRGSFCF